MARTTAMRLVELMILRQDIHNVLKYLGEFGDFQFQQDFSFRFSVFKYALVSGGIFRLSTAFWMALL